jgi:hypothetical protein
MAPWTIVAFWLQMSLISAGLGCVLYLLAFEATSNNIESHFTAASKHGGGELVRASFDNPKANRKKVIFENMMASVEDVSFHFGRLW